ncbi:type I secretion system permease/ATPase [Rhodobacteraceae bacterium]|nr:type I secretion system permease/ATPase [Paracoccaceae bacterium]
MSKGSEEFREIANNSRHFLWFALVFSVFVNILMMTGPLFMLQVYDRVLGSRSEETLVALVVLVLGLYGFMWLLDFARSRLLARYGARFQSSMDDRVFEAQLGNDGSRPETASAQRDLEAVQGVFASSALTSIMDVPFTPLFIGVIFIFHPLLGWFALAGGLVLVCITLLSQVLTSKRVSEAQGRSEIANRFGENARRASELIRGQGMIQPVTERWMSHRMTALQDNMTAVDWTGAFSTFTKSFRLSLQSLVLALGAWLVLGGEMSAGAMIAGSILLGRALAPIEQIIGRWPQIARARQGWLSLRTFWDQMPDIPERTQLPPPSGQLDVKGVTISTAPGKPPLLYNVSFSVAPGEALGVIGKSGSGKTTIARTVLGLVTPTLGECRLGGALIQHYRAEDLGTYIGYLPQDPMLITGTIAENIARMSMEPDSAMVVAAAQKAKAHELILSLPDGYETRIEDNKIGLSGGQRQRIALARALFGDPVLLVLDEPNSALDQEGSDALNSAISTMKAEGRSVIIMTHRPIAISQCDTLLIVEKGAVKAQGPRDEIIKSMMKNSDGISRMVGDAQK